MNDDVDEAQTLRDCVMSLRRDDGSRAALVESLIGLRRQRFWSPVLQTHDMATFPIAQRKEWAAHGRDRTTRLILERDDAMAAAATSGTEYETVLDPLPADPSPAHDPSIRPEWADLYLAGGDDE